MIEEESLSEAQYTLLPGSEFRSKSKSKKVKPLKKSSSTSKSKRPRIPRSLASKVLSLYLSLFSHLSRLVSSLPKGGASRRESFKQFSKWVRSGFQTCIKSPRQSFALASLCLLPPILLALFLLASSSSSNSPSLHFRFSLSHSSSLSNLQDIHPETEEDVPLPAVTERKKLTKKKEIEFACDEVTCIESCVRKVTNKCKKSEGCMRQRLSQCKKKCRKQRCEKRCKLDPIIGYVEREMKLDKCKEDCAGSSKCVEKCDKLYQTCKSKCAERRKKFVCDREPVLPSNAPNEKGEEASDAGEDDDGMEQQEQSLSPSSLSELEDGEI